jgi:hypothetical protein
LFFRGLDTVILSLDTTYEVVVKLQRYFALLSLDTTNEVVVKLQHYFASLDEKGLKLVIGYPG